MPDQKKKKKEPDGLIEKIKSYIFESDGELPVGTGGRKRQMTLDEKIQRMQTGQTTDSNN